MKRAILLILILCIAFCCSKVNEASSDEKEQQIDINAGDAISDRYGIYLGEEEFAVNIPESGDYHIQYITETKSNNKYIPGKKAGAGYMTETDTFDLILNVLDSALIFITLDSISKVHDATLTRIIISNSSTPPQGTQVSESVILYYASGDIIPWDNISPKPESYILVLIEDGNITPDSEVIVLEKEEVYPGDYTCIGTHTLENSYNVFACQISQGFTLATDSSYWIRMSIGFETENGEADARSAKSDITLPVTMDGVSLTMVDTTIVEYNEPAGFWEVNAYYCSGRLTTGQYIIIGESYNKEIYVDRAVCVLTVK